MRAPGAGHDLESRIHRYDREIDFRPTAEDQAEIERSQAV